MTSRGRSPWLPRNTTIPVPLTAERIEQRFTAPENYNLYPQASLHTQWPSGYGKGVMGDPVFDIYFTSLVPSISSAASQQATVQAAGAALLDRIGRPVILIGHSQGGIMPWLIADARPQYVNSIIGLEPSGPPFVESALNGGTPARAYGLTDIPLTYAPPVTDPAVDLVKKVTPSNSSSITPCSLQAGSPPPRQLPNFKNITILVVTAEASWHAMYDWCTVEYLRQAGVETKHISLADEGIHGNGHMFFLETNSDAIADVLRNWIERS